MDQNTLDNIPLVEQDGILDSDEVNDDTYGRRRKEELVFKKIHEIRKRRLQYRSLSVAILITFVGGIALAVSWDRRVFSSHATSVDLCVLPNEPTTQVIGDMKEPEEDIERNGMKDSEEIEWNGIRQLHPDTPQQKVITALDRYNRLTDVETSRKNLYSSVVNFLQEIKSNEVIGRPSNTYHDFAFIHHNLAFHNYSSLNLSSTQIKHIITLQVFIRNVVSVLFFQNNAYNLISTYMKLRYDLHPQSEMLRFQFITRDEDDEPVFTFTHTNIASYLSALKDEIKKMFRLRSKFMYFLPHPFYFVPIKRGIVTPSTIEDFVNDPKLTIEDKYWFYYFVNLLRFSQSKFAQISSSENCTYVFFAEPKYISSQTNPKFSSLVYHNKACHWILNSTLRRLIDQSQLSVGVIDLPENIYLDVETISVFLQRITLDPPSDKNAQKFATLFGFSYPTRQDLDPLQRLMFASVDNFCSRYIFSTFELQFFILITKLISTVNSVRPWLSVFLHDKYGIRENTRVEKLELVYKRIVETKLFLPNRRLMKTVGSCLRFYDLLERALVLVRG